MDSIWKSGTKLPEFPELESDMKVDVLIIGGGITGILCAHFLQERGVDYVLCEAGTVCSGTTGNTTAKITAQHGLIYNKILKGMGLEAAAMYLHANLAAVEKFAELCTEIDCNFERKTSYVYSKESLKNLENEADALARIGFYSNLSDKTELPFPVAGALAFNNQAQFNPLKFLSHIAEGLNIYQNTLIAEFMSVEGHVGGKMYMALTDKGKKIIFRKAVFATHFPLNNKHGLFFLKLYQHRSYVMALNNVPKIHGMYVDENKKGMSFRSFEDTLLIGGGGHRTGKKGGNWQELREFIRLHYPDCKVISSWAAQDCMSLDGVPYIGNYSKNMPGCFVASGYNKWGMTSSMTAAMLLADMITEKGNPYAKVFDPSRSMAKPQLFLNGWEAATNLMIPAKKRCPHMGCGLKWNATEHSWDCPCHGSRFTEGGKVLDNPANGDLKK
ncbi:MAG: FAD-dependent oxidoreductase [Anaerovoracaceae bacterium]